MTDLTLCELQDETIDYLLGMQLDDKRAYFHKLIETYYPNALDDELEYEELLQNYISSMYVEKPIPLNFPFASDCFFLSLKFL